MRKVVAGIVSAADNGRSFPLLKMGNISVVQRIVITLKQAGVLPVVVLIGLKSASEIKAELAKEGVIFVENQQVDEEQFQAVKLGLKLLKGKAERVVFSPVNVPMFLPATLSMLIGAKGGIVTPVHDSAGGHPVVIDMRLADKILEYNGERGLAGAISELESERVRIQTDDEGVIANAHTAEQLEKRLQDHNNAILRLSAKLSLERETEFFDDRTKLLLYLLEFSGSVKNACDSMSISYRKAWQLLDELENVLKFDIVIRRHGGAGGGRTELTDKGRAFLHKYIELESKVKSYAQCEFRQIFGEI